MKVTGNLNFTATFPGNTASWKPLNPHLSQPDPDPRPRRRARNPSLTRLRKSCAPTGRRSRPETPLLKWKIEDRVPNAAAEEDGENPKTGGRRALRKSTRTVSVRKIAAGLWRLQLPPETLAAGSVERKRKDPLGLQSGTQRVAVAFVPRHNGKYETKDLPESPASVSDMKKRFFCKVEPSFQFSNPAMESATKWDPVCLGTSDEACQIYSHMKCLNRRVNARSVVPALEAELEQARAHIQELETERSSLKRKLEHFLKKVSEEKAAWRSREHEKIRAFIEDVKIELNRERKNRQRLEIMNSKLINELADTKVLAKRYLQDCEKEMKARELIEEVCDELAKEIGEDKAEVEALKRDSMKLREEVDEERKMLQMAEVWREERVQMKLVDAKVALEEKYSQMNKLIADLESFIRSRNANLELKEMRQAELLVQATASVNIQDMKEFTYEPPDSDNIFSILEDDNQGEPNEREIETCVAYSPASHASNIHTVSPESNLIDKNGHRNFHAFVDQYGDMEEDESGWETVSHLDDQGSSYSPDGSAPSVNKNHRDSNVSGSGTELEENGCNDTPITETSELCHVPTKHAKKISSIARLWRSCPNNGDNYKVISMDEINGRLSNGMKSNGGILSPDQGSGKGGLSPPALGDQWSSPASGYPHITRGMKGCIEWPRGVQKYGLKAKLLEARKEGQKVQLRHVLKQKF
uniref:Uncharacterized protein n=1 Tax=Rhizophora mucronata TaxID=61149 RepID=A0A2P2PIF3_RHIMU